MVHFRTDATYVIVYGQRGASGRRRSTDAFRTLLLRSDDLVQYRKMYYMFAAVFGSARDGVFRREFSTHVPRTVYTTRVFDSWHAAVAEVVLWRDHRAATNHRAASGDISWYYFSRIRRWTAPKSGRKLQRRGAYDTRIYGWGWNAWRARVCTLLKSRQIRPHRCVKPYNMLYLNVRTYVDVHRIIRMYKKFQFSCTR